MKKISEKYGFRMKIFILFLLLVILPYLLVVTTIYRMFLDYTGKNWGKSMEDTMLSIGNQVSSSLDVYENSTMNLYYSGCVDMLESGNVDKEKVLKAVKSLEGLNPTEWNMVNRAVDEALMKKRKELDVTIKLSSEELSKIIQSGFGYILD